MKKKTEVQEATVAEEDYELDEVRGNHGKKPKMAVLNKSKLSKWEMDELFMGEDTAKGEY